MARSTTYAIIYLQGIHVHPTLEKRQERQLKYWVMGPCRSFQGDRGGNTVVERGDRFYQSGVMLINLNHHHHERYDEACENLIQTRLVSKHVIWYILFLGFFVTIPCDNLTFRFFDIFHLIHLICLIHLQAFDRYLIDT